MSEAEPPDSERLEAVQKLWDFARQLYQSKGIDIEKLLADLAAKQEEQLPFPGARRDLTELCEAGCTREILGAIIFVLRVVPAIESFWAFIVGHAERRRKLTRTLEATAKELDHFFPEVNDEANQEKLRAKLRARFADVGHLYPSELASELRFYAGFLTLAERLASDTEARNLGQVLKYTLVGYVDRATGRFHDKNVMGLYAEVVGSTTLDEVAHRMWRKRNYSRLDRHFTGLADFLFDIGVVIARSRT